MEGGPNGEATVYYGGVALPNVPKSSTWAMMLLGFGALASSAIARRERASRSPPDRRATAAKSRSLG